LANLLQQDDLYAFHARVFSSIDPPAHLVSTRDDLFNGATLDYNDRDENDDLGYYPDGNKRTLTDNQVAIFRDSEIYSILRERQVRRENREADGDERSESEISNTEAAEAPLPSDEEGEVQSDNATSGNTTAVQSRKEKMIWGSARTSSKNKRKRHRSDGGDRHDTEPTHRRLVRELDSVIADNQVLDYGDEPLATVEANTPQAEIVLEAAVSTAEEAMSEADASAQSRKQSVEGKKIWWPMLGT